MKPLQLHCFQHVDFEGPAMISNWTDAQQHTLTYTRFYDSQFMIPSMNELDGLIIMGGPMSVSDEKQYPWLKEEKKAILQAIEKGIPVLGICLGAQLIASTLGASVTQNRVKEIGWFELTMHSNETNKLIFGNDSQLNQVVFHWHGDTFSIPTGAMRLAESNACQNQAFLYKENVLGLQFHLEVTAVSLNNMLKHGKKELIPDTYIQSAQCILSGVTYIDQNHTLLYKVLEYLFKRIR
jgi:GMP synthase-like glutamine amidotransferase